MERMTRPSDESPKPRLTLRRRTSDFSNRHRGPPLLQMGTTTCCCCCCLHWIGAAAGMAVGSASAARSTKEEAWPINPKARRYVVRGAWLGLLSAPLLIVVVPMGLAFVPSLAAIPIGVGAMLGGLRARSLERSVAAPDGGPRPEKSYAMQLAWRIAWRSFLYSTLFSGIGYLLMLLIAVLVR
jgi:ABC-type Fe3+ transport system permease subunit